MKKSLTRVMLVEDEPDIRLIGHMVLEAVGGLQTELAENGREALSKVKGFRPDLILLDVMMPYLDGPSTLRQLLADPETAGIPVIFMTAKVQPQEVAGYLALGAIGVIPKPYNPVTLVEAIRELWEMSASARNAPTPLAQ